MDLQDIKKKLVTKSERVKCVDIHPKEPWAICSLYNGQVSLWNYDTASVVKTWDILDQPVRTVKFIVRQNWFICGSDDMHCRVFNYNTMEKVSQFEAHQDYIRSVAVHDQLPYVLTSSDDMTIKLWDWSKNWANTKMFEGHTHYVMMVVFNPKDPNTFASASLDQTVKVWNLTSTAPNFTLEHEKGVNCVEYFPGGDKPYLVSGSDDRTIKVWDYQTKACVHTLTGHTHNVSSVIFHPDLPLLISGSEDDTVNVYDLQTYRLEKNLNFGLGRVWCINAKTGVNKIAMGCDKGMVVIRLGREDPAYSMDVNGKVVFAANREIQRMDVKVVVGMSAEEQIQDGEKLMLQTKELATMETVPTKLEHNNTGQFICVMAGGEYSINTALAWRPKCYGPAISFAWGPETGQYVILENSTTLKTFKNFKEKNNVRLPSSAKDVFCGSSALFGVRFEGSVTFYDWETLYIVRNVALASEVKNIFWNEAGSLVALVTDTTLYILRFNRNAVQDHIEQTGGRGGTPDGLDFAFDVVEELDEKVRQGQWIGDVFLFTNKSLRVNYYVAGNVYTITVMERPAYLLGYVPKESRVYLMDRERAVISYFLPQSLLDFKSAIALKNLEQAQALLAKIPQSLYARVAKFLEHQGYRELAMTVTDDDEHKFELAVSIKNLGVATSIARKQDRADKWKHLGDLAMRLGDFDLAAESLFAAQDFNGLMLLFSVLRHANGLRKVCELARSKNRFNIAFACAQMLGDVTLCINVLLDAKRIPEAAIFARSHGCSAEEIAQIVQRWKLELTPINPKLAECIADPVQFPNLFPEVAQKKAEPTPQKPSTPEKLQTQSGSDSFASTGSMLSPIQPKAPPASPMIPAVVLNPASVSPIAPSPTTVTKSPVSVPQEEVLHTPETETPQQAPATTSSPKQEEQKATPKQPIPEFDDPFDDEPPIAAPVATTSAVKASSPPKQEPTKDDLDDIFDMKDD